MRKMTGPRLMELTQPEVREIAPPAEPEWRIVGDYLPASGEKTAATKEKKKSMFDRLTSLLGL